MLDHFVTIYRSLIRQKWNTKLKTNINNVNENREGHYSLSATLMQPMNILYNK